MWQVTPEHQIRERWRAGPFLRKAARILSSIVVLGGVVFFTLSFFPNLWPGRGTHAAPRTATMSNMKQLATALQRYAADNDDRLPADFSSNEDLRAALDSYGLDDSIFETRNPEGGQILPNSELASIELSGIHEPRDTALLYETRSWWIHSGSVYAFVDTSVRPVSPEAVIRFSPGPPAPDYVPVNKANLRRFRIGQEDYRIIECGEPEIEVSVEKWDGKRWVVLYKGVSSSDPIIEWERKTVSLYLRQPPTEIDGMAQVPGRGPLERVTVDKDGVRSRLVDGSTIHQ